MNDWPTGPYRCIVADPPWPQEFRGGMRRRKDGRRLPYKQTLPYPTMTAAEIAALPVRQLAEPGAHLWLWTTNRHLRQAFDVLEAWGFTYLTTITWCKPSGVGAWFAATTQHCLFGYCERCVFPRERYLFTHFNALPGRHSEKPEAFYSLVRRVSEPPALDLFNRRVIPGFDGWGNESPGVRQPSFDEAAS